MFTWLTITTPWGGEQLTITAELSFDIGVAVALTETWTFRGRLCEDTDRVRSHLGDHYEVESCHAAELVLRQHRSVPQLFSRGTSATPMSIGEDLDSEVLLAALPLLLPAEDLQPC